MSSRGVERFMLLRKVIRSWATKSLIVGAAATAIDLVVGVGLLVFLEAHADFSPPLLGFFGTPTRLAAMMGTVVGSTFNFFANRYFSFAEPNPQLAAPALRFALVTLLSILAHAQVVVFLRDGWAVPYVLAKIIADLCVFTAAQPFVLRYVVFPRRKASTASPSA